MVVAALLTGLFVGIMIGVIAGLILEDTMDLLKIRDKIRE